MGMSQRVDPLVVEDIVREGTTDLDTVQKQKSKIALELKCSSPYVLD